MKKRIGNDITFTWHIYRKNGDTQVPESFAGKDVEIKLISPLQRPVTIEDVSIATGVVTFTFRGKHQVTLGNYVAVLLENKGEDGMVTLDVVNAVTLVAHSYMEEDGDEGDVIEASSVELESSISAGGGGGFVQQQADWAQTDASAVDFIKNKPDLNEYTKQVASKISHEQKYTGRHTITGTLHQVIYPTNNYRKTEMQPEWIRVVDARGENVKSIRMHFDDDYNPQIETLDDKVVWQNTATQQIPTATTEDNGLMSASDKSKLDALPTNEQLTEELGDKADSAGLAEVATSGSYNDLSDKPTIPAAQVQSDWNESDTTSKAYIKNKPTIPTVPANVSAFNNDAGYITASDVAAKQDKMSIVQVASGTTAINAAINTYYEVTGEVGTMAITLPEPTDTTKVAIVVIHLLAGTTPNVVIGSTAVIDYSSTYDISAGNEYEINCLFNGDKWVVADMEVV